MVFRNFSGQVGLIIWMLAMGGLSAEFPKNLLRVHAGAGWEAGSGPSLLDDPSVTYKVVSGKETWVADLGQYHVVDRVSLYQSGLSGTLNLEVTPSIHLPSWQPLGTVKLEKVEGTVAVALIPSAGRYIRFTLDTKSAGLLGGLGLFGPLLKAELQPVPLSAWAQTGPSYHLPEVFSLTNGLTRTKVKVDGSIGGKPEYVHDEDVATSLRVSEDTRIVINLEETLELKCLVILQSKVSGTWKAFVNDEAYHGNVVSGVAKVEFEGVSAAAVELVWKGEGDPSDVHEIALFPSRGLPKVRGYGKNGSFGKNASLGKQESPESLDDASSNVVGGGTPLPYFGLRGTGGLAAPSGFLPGSTVVEAEDEGVPDITPASR